MFKLLESSNKSWNTHDYLLKRKRFTIRFNLSDKSQPLSYKSWVYDVEIEFGDKKLHKKWNLHDQGISLLELEEKINKNAKEFIKEYYKELLT